MEPREFVDANNKDRIGQMGEVYTPIPIVNKMLDLLKAEGKDTDINLKILEPTCGNGRFLVEITKRRLSVCRNWIDVIKAISGIYGIDIMADNINECRENMCKQVREMVGLLGENNRAIKACDAIISRNLVLGDLLQGVKLDRHNKCLGELTMIEWRFIGTDIIEPIEFSINQPDLEIKRFDSIVALDIDSKYIESLEVKESFDDYDDLL